MAVPRNDRWHPWPFFRRLYDAALSRLTWKEVVGIVRSFMKFYLAQTRIRMVNRQPPSISEGVEIAYCGSLLCDTAERGDEKTYENTPMHAKASVLSTSLCWSPTILCPFAANQSYHSVALMARKSNTRYHGHSMVTCQMRKLLVALVWQPAGTATSSVHLQQMWVVCLCLSDCRQNTLLAGFPLRLM